MPELVDLLRLVGESSSPIGAFMIHEGGVLEEVGRNPDAELCGQESTRREWPDAIPLRTLLARHGQESLGVGQAVTFEHRCQDTSGAQRWCQVTVQPVGPGRCLWLAADVSRQKVEEERRLTHAERLDYAVRGMNDGIWDWRVDTGEAYFSPRWCEMLGYRFDEVPQNVSGWSDSVHPDDQPWVSAALQRHFARETERYEVTHRVRNKAGEWQWILARGEVVQWSPEGKPLRMVGAHTDVTAQKRAEQQLQEQERRTAALMQLAPVGIYYTDREGYCLYVNEAWRNIAGLTLEEALGPGWVRSLHPDDLEATRQEWRRFLSEGGPFHLGFRFLAPDGAVRHVISRATRLLDEDGALIGAIGTVLDITSERAREEALTDQRAQMTASARLAALGEMAGGLAHELNTPLAVMSLTVEQLQAQARVGVVPPDRVDRGLARLESTLGRVTRIIRSLRSFARDGEGDAPEEVALGAFTEDVLSFCRERILNHGVRLHVSLPEPAALASLSTTQLAQVLLNLLNNAHDAVVGQELAWIEVSAECVGGAVRFVVSDSGPGVSEALRERIFEPFFTTRAVGQGTGLGLPISKGLVERMGGSLRLDTTAPHTRFVVELPGAVRHAELVGGIVAATANPPHLSQA
jgi:PAS domain S-box-containing protein